MFSTMSVQSIGRASSLKVALLALAVGGCGEQLVCLAQPCPQAVAVVVNVMSGAAGAYIPNVSLLVNGDSVSACAGTAAGPCAIYGGAGAYNITISAPGYAPAQRTVNVAGAEAKGCGCATPHTVTVDVTLATMGS